MERVAITRIPASSRLLKKELCRLLKKISEARRAKNRSFDYDQDRLEAYLAGTLQRGD